MLLAASRHQNHAQQRTYLCHGPPPHTCRRILPPPVTSFYFLLLDVVFFSVAIVASIHVCCLPVPMKTKRQPQPSPETQCVKHMYLNSHHMHVADLYSPNVPGKCNFCVGPKPSTQLCLHPLSHPLHVEMLRMCFRGLGGYRSVAHHLSSMQNKGPGSFSVPCTAKQRTWSS